MVTTGTLEGTYDLRDVARQAKARTAHETANATLRAQLEADDAVLDAIDPDA